MKSSFLLRAATGMAIALAILPVTAFATSVTTAASLTTARPIDSSPDHDGQIFYFTTAGSRNEVLKVAAQGGPVTPIAAGLPLVNPRGITVGSDDRRVYVTDPGASGGGAIFTIPVSGGQPVIVWGSAGTSPQSVTLVRRQGDDWIYFTGIDPINGLPAVFKLATEGDSGRSVIAEGPPFVHPEGLAIDRDGNVFVSDSGAGSKGRGAVFEVNQGTVSSLVPEVITGTPAGIALTENERTLLVSALTADGDHARVLLVDLETSATTSFTQVVSQNPGAGGLHRALDSGIFSWCGVASGSSGTVYRISLG